MSKLINLCSYFLNDLDEELIPFDWVSNKKSPIPPSNDYWNYDIELYDPFNIGTISDYSSFEEFVESYHPIHSGFGYYYKAIDNLGNVDDPDELKDLYTKTYLSTLTRSYDSIGITEVENLDLRKTQYNRFLNLTAKEYPQETIRALYANPLVMTDETINQVLSKIKETGYQLSEDDFSFFSSSYDYSNGDQQKKNFLKIFEQLARSEDQDFKTILDLGGEDW